MNQQSNSHPHTINPDDSNPESTMESTTDAQTHNPDSGHNPDSTNSDTQDNSAQDNSALAHDKNQGDKNQGDKNQGNEEHINDGANIATLEAKIAELETQVKEAKEAQARANAESYNAQRRMEQESEKAKKFALQKFVKDLLEVVDNLERAITSVNQDDNADDAVIEGVKLTHKSMLSVLHRHGVEVIDPLGEKFNPDFHEAVGIFPDAEPDHVGVVLQKGYTLNGRTVRPAMVQVGA